MIREASPLEIRAARLGRSPAMSPKRMTTRLATEPQPLRVIQGKGSHHESVITLGVRASKGCVMFGTMSFVR